MGKSECATLERSRDRAGAGVPCAERRYTATRADLLDGVAEACPSLSRGEARGVFKTVLEEVSAALVRGEPVRFRGFGQFAVREKRERLGRNPRTGVEAPIKPRRVLTFRPSPVLNNLVNGLDPNGTDTDRELS